MQNNQFQKELYFLQSELNHCKDELKKRDILRILNSITYKYDDKLHLNFLHELDKWYDNKPKDFVYFKNRIFFIDYFREKTEFEAAYAQCQILIDYMTNQLESDYGYHFNTANLFIESYTWTGNREPIWQAIFHLEKCLEILNQNVDKENTNSYTRNVIYYILSKCYLELDNTNLAIFYNQLSDLKTIQLSDMLGEDIKKNSSYTDLEYLFRNSLYQETIELSDEILSTTSRKIYIKLSHFEYESNLPEHPTAKCFAYIYKSKALSKLSNHKASTQNAELAYQLYQNEQINEYYTLRECIKVLYEAYEANQEYQKACHFSKLYISLIERNAQNLHYFGSLFLSNLNEKHSLVAMRLGSLIDWTIQNTSSQEAIAEAEKICFFIQKNISNPLYGVAQLADDLLISERTLERKTLLYFNTIPSKMIVENKMNAAKFMLRQKAWNISQIATYVGFSSSSYFSQTFRKHTGKSPSEYLSDF